MTILGPQSPIPGGNRVSVLMAAFNEATTIETVITKVLELELVNEIIVVDDCSDDETPKIVARCADRDPRVKLISLPANQGKTAAIRRALAEVTGDIVIIQDADLEYDPAEIPAVVAPIIEGRADVVYGSRFLVRRAARVLYYYHAVANAALTALSNLFTNLNMTDVETGYKAFRREVIEGIPLTSSRFGMEVEITASVARLGVRIYEVPISYYGRTYEAGKKIGLRDGISALWYIVFYNAVESRSARRRAYFSSVRSRIAQLEKDVGA